MDADQEPVFLDVIDADTNTSYKIKLSAADAQRAFDDTGFATALLRAHIAESDAQPLDVVCDDQTGHVLSECDEKGMDDFQESGPHKWTHSACLLFLEVYKEVENSFHTGKSSVKACWTKVANIMNEKGYQITWDKCAIKFNSLKRTYKSVTDNNKKSGSNPRKWIYYEACDEIFKKKPWVEPLSTASSFCFKDVEDKSSTKEPCAKKIKLDAAVQNYLDQSLAAKKEASELKLKQQQAKLERLDKMNLLLEKLIAKSN